MRFTGRTAIVTGGGTGIGRAVALRFAAEGGRVVIAGRTAETGEAVAREIARNGGTAAYVHCDVSSADQVKDCVSKSLALSGHLNLLVNAAGIEMVRTSITEISEDNWTKMLNTNLGGVFHMTRAVIPHLASAGGGVIVNVASITGLSATPRAAPYISSKGAVIALTRSLAIDYAPYRIRVNCVCPGAVDTPMMDRMLSAYPDPQKVRSLIQSFHPLGRIGLPEDVAAAVLFLASDDASWITGIALPVDGGYMAGRAVGPPPPLS